jgi:hypothetical protein
MKTHTKVALFVAVLAALALAAPVAAQSDGTGAIPSCSGDTISGTVVTVDEESGEVTVYSRGEYCTVTLDGEYGHPIVDLLGKYFNDLTPEGLAEELDAKPTGCALQDASGNWALVACGTDGAKDVTVIAENDDGSFVILINGEEVPGTLLVTDPTIAGDLSTALQAFGVDWSLDGSGGVILGAEVAAYHDEGMGFGVLVKLYSMAAALHENCTSTEATCTSVEDLVQAFQSGTGMGELFKLYGKPKTLGVGHVRKIVRSMTDGDVEPSIPDDGEPSAEEGGDEYLQIHSSRNARPSTRGAKPEHAGPKPKRWEQTDASGAAEENDPKPKPVNATGKPDNAGPKPKDPKENNRPEHAGPKPKPENNAGKPDHAGPKNKPNKKDK